LEVEQPDARDSKIRSARQRRKLVKSMTS